MVCCHFEKLPGNLLDKCDNKQRFDFLRQAFCPPYELRWLTAINNGKSCYQFIDLFQNDSIKFDQHTALNSSLPLAQGNSSDQNRSLSKPIENHIFGKTNCSIMADFQALGRCSSENTMDEDDIFRSLS